MTKEIIKKIYNKALLCGFEEFGVTNFEDFDFYSNNLLKFVKKEYYGEMEWVKDKVEKRRNPKNMWPNAKSALVFSINYGPEFKMPTN